LTKSGLLKEQVKLIWTKKKFFEFLTVLYRIIFLQIDLYINEKQIQIFRLKNNNK